MSVKVAKDENWGKKEAEMKILAYSTSENYKKTVNNWFPI